MSISIKHQPLRLGVVGCGRIAQIVLPMLAPRGIEVVALCDVNTEAANSLATQLEGPRVMPDAAALIADPSVEAVYLATPPATHRDLILQAAAAGKAVVCEKPWVLNAQEARNLARALDRYPGVQAGSCASRFRFTAAVAAAESHLSSGALGRIRQVRIDAVTPLPVPLCELPPWKRSAATAGGGLAADWCVYEIDWVAAVIGAAFDPVAVNATLDDWRREGTGLDSGYSIHIRCASGLDVRLNRRPEVAPKRHNVEIRGETGGLDIPFAPDAAQRTARLHQLGADGKSVESAELAVVDDWGSILCGPIVNLAEAVRGAATVASPPASQVLVHTVLDGIHLSGREERTVCIPS